MRKMIGFQVDGGFIFALHDDGSLWVQGSESDDWQQIPGIPQDDAQEQISDIIDAGMQEYKFGCTAYTKPIKDIMDGIEEKQGGLAEDSGEYKDLQLLLEMLDMAWGLTDLSGEPGERITFLEDSKKIVNKMEVME